MTQIDPAELSALLDGELSAARTGAVEAALAADGALRAEYEALRALDVRVRAAARGAAFHPRISVATARLTLAGVSLALALVGVRVGQKLIDDLEPALLLHAVAMALLVAGLFWLARRSGEFVATDNLAPNK